MPKSFDWEDAYHSGADLRGTADMAWSDPQVTLEELIAALGGEIFEGNKVAAPGRGQTLKDRSLWAAPDQAYPNGFSSNDPKYVLERLLVYRQRKGNGPSKASASSKTKSKTEGGKKNNADDAASSTAWRARLLFTHAGQPKAVLANAILALRKAPDWQGVLAYDEFALTTMAMRPQPWARSQDNTWTPRGWTDRDDALATEWMQRENINVTVNTAATAAETVAKDRSFHPVRDYLRGLQWDGKFRVEKFAARYLGSPDTGYSTKVSKCMLIAGVARIMEPGCKSDHIVILEGKQGTGKSTALRLLFEPFFSDDLSELGTKDAQMQMNGIWCLEIAELTSMRKAEQERVKAFVSRSTDRFRPPYARRLIEAKRQCVLIGTTNSDQYLKDETGARRFWPLRCREIGLDAIKQDRDQLWAEAVSLYDNGVPWWLTDNQDIAEAEEQQAERYVEDPWTDCVEAYLKDKDMVSVSDILAEAVRKSKEQWTQADQNRIAAILRAQGIWKRGWARVKGGPSRVYRRQCTGSTTVDGSVDT